MANTEIIPKKTNKHEKLSNSETASRVKDIDIVKAYKVLGENDTVTLTPLSRVATIANLMYEDANTYSYAYLNSNNFTGSVKGLMSKMAELEAKNGFVTVLNNKTTMYDAVSFFATGFYGVIDPSLTIDGRMSYTAKIMKIVGKKNN